MTVCPIINKPYRMINQMQHFAWGTRNQAAYIPRLLNMQPHMQIEQLINAHLSMGDFAAADEQQAYTLDEIKRQQREQYMDIDRRLLQLETGQAGTLPGAAPGLEGGTAPVSPAGTPPVVSGREVSLK